MSKSKAANSLKQDFWNYFFVDNFSDSTKAAEHLLDIASTDEEKQEALEFKSRILLKQARYVEACELLKDIVDYSPLKIFLDFLVTANTGLLDLYQETTESHIFKAQSMVLTRIYCGLDEEKQDEPEVILEQVFKDLVDKEDYDRAILSYAQIIELLFKEQELGKDIIKPIASEQIENLLKLSKKAKYDSTRAKVYLLKAKIFHSKEAAEDAEILFGKDNNKNGLADVYSFYAVDCKDFDYFEKSLKYYKELGNHGGQVYLYEAIASLSLLRGSIKEACDYFEKAEEMIASGGLFEKYGLTIQRLSLHAVKGEFKDLTKKIEEKLKEEEQIPKLFRAQIYQIYATNLMQTTGDIEGPIGYIDRACDLFQELRKYNQLLNAKNIHFQMISIGDDLDEIVRYGEEIIQIANRLGRHEEKASKYVDIAFAMVRIHSQNNTLDAEILNTISDYFKKAIKIHQDTFNQVGEADVYQAMGNMFANVGKLQEGFDFLAKAKNLYKEEGALLQASITATLIGLLLMLSDASIVNEDTYKVAQENFEEALEYFKEQDLIDLIWKTYFYLGELNEIMFYLKKEDSYSAKAKEYFLKILESEMPDDKDELPNQISLGSTTLSDAYAHAYKFFDGLGDKENAAKFKRSE